MVDVAKVLVFLDDERNFEDVTWIQYPVQYGEVKVFRTFNQFMNFCKNTNLVNVDFSFDHDIQDFVDGVEKTGYDCVKCLFDLAFDGLIAIDLKKSNIVVHSQNPVGRQNIISYTNNAIKYLE